MALPPIAQILANAPQNYKVEKGNQDGLTETNLVHTCPIVVAGLSMPWPLYSEKVRINNSNLQLVKDQYQESKSQAQSKPMDNLSDPIITLHAGGSGVARL